MQRIVVVGASVVDVLVKSKELKVLKSHEVDGGVAMCEVMGGKIDAEDSEVCTGGGGSNVAVGLIRLGQAVKLVTRIGGDRLGKFVEEELNSYQVDTSMLQKGEILVTSMTTPEYIVAMEKSAAIITDEGGVLCHAAIVSREMNIPCVIGTKIATKVLKTGDLIEVDANNGLIKIL